MRSVRLTRRPDATSPASRASQTRAQPAQPCQIGLMPSQRPDSSHLESAPWALACVALGRLLRFEGPLSAPKMSSSTLDLAGTHIPSSERLNRGGHFRVTPTVLQITRQWQCSCGQTTGWLNVRGGTTADGAGRVLRTLKHHRVSSRLVAGCWDAGAEVHADQRRARCDGSVGMEGSPGLHRERESCIMHPITTARWGARPTDRSA